MIRDIPTTAKEIQEGLYMNESIFYVAGIIKTIKRELYAKTGYCFYNKTEKIYNELGLEVAENDIKVKDRTYMQYAILGLLDSEKNYVSCPITSEMEIV